MKIHIISKEELEKIPIGDPVPSACSPANYGDHSCMACCSRLKCPISKDIDTPNQCSFYWPPNAILQEPGQGYWNYLNKIAQERREN